MLLIDVIIPLYNSEAYITELLSSLENQVFKEFRVIFVNDGSKDRTQEILEEKLQDVSFAYIVVQQENKGLPGARNTGIRHAQAPWITFMDSDDGLDPHYLEFLYRGVTQSGCDAGVCEYQMICEPQQAAAVRSQDFSVSKVDAATCMKTYYTKWFGAWVWILRREWLEHTGLVFDEQCTYLEDVPFNTQVIAAADSIAVVDNPVYLYYKREGSLMRTPKIEKYQIALDGFHRMQEKVQKSERAAAEEFRKMGRARYYLATLRRGAILMPFAQFKELCALVPMEQAKGQLSYLQTMQRFAGRLYLISKRAFYCAMRWMTVDN